MPNQLPMQIVDPNAEFRGVSVAKLMDRAGKESTKAILAKFGKMPSVQIFCGGGNNGGDGFALAAELLKQKIEVEVILAIPKSRIRTNAAKFHFTRLPKKIVSFYSKNTKISGEILIDALLGISQEGKLKKPFSEIIAKLKKSKAKIVSLDIPTDNLKADLVIAFHISKKSQNEVVVPIGIPKSAEKFFGPGDVRVNFPKRAKTSHKGENGRVVIVGGSRDYLGAPLFAGFGAAAAGVDLIDIFVPKINFTNSRKFSPNFLLHEFKGNPNLLTLEATREILDFAKKVKATIVLGPGLGRNQEIKEAIQFFAKKCQRPLLLDADALIPDLPKFASKKVVLTPHAGEYKKIPKKLNAVILKKGKVDKIIDKNKERWNDTGNAVLTVGGTGDILAGLVGGLLARGVEAFEAAGIAAFLLGLAGERITLKSESATPQVIAREIPKIVQEILLKKF